MQSPFFTAAQKTLYPYRKRTESAEQVATHIKFLIKNNIETSGNLSNTPIGQLQHKYFLGASVNDILTGLKLNDNNK